MKGSIVLPGGVGLCNAVRRALLSDLKSWAPCEVDIRVNSSCQTDEFLAHRIGLIPFRRVADGTGMILSAEGPTIVYASDITGPSFEAIHGDIVVMVLGKGSQLDLSIRFDQRKASAHARYAMCAAVGMERIDGDGRHRIVFDTIDEQPPDRVLNEAIDAVETRVDGALRQLGRQPAVPPRSMC